MHDNALDQSIPDHWSADQALAVVDFLEALAQQIWSCYGLAIRDIYPPRASVGPPKPRQLALPFPPPWHGDHEDIPW